MAKVHLLPDGKTLDASPSETLLRAALGGDVPLAHACGGQGRCSTCRVLVLDGGDRCSPRTPEEGAIASRLGFDGAVRLACQMHVHGDVTVRRLIVDDEDLELSGLFLSNSSPGLAGIEKHVLIMFVDIRGFTSFSEHLLPYDVIHVLNRYFRRMGAVIHQYGGVIDNYIGDGFLALFEAVELHESALRAIRAGITMLESVEGGGAYLERIFGRRFEIGIGLHYGLVVAGTVGEGPTGRTTIIGDAVNFASRVEAANKQAGTRFLVSKSVYNLVAGRIVVGRTLETAIPGKTGLHELFEVLALA